MQRILVSALSLSIWTCVAIPLLAEAKIKTVDPKAKANQQVLAAANKSGVRSQDLRELAGALKQDSTLGDAVKDAIQQGLKDKELAQFIRQRLSDRKKRANATANLQAAGDADPGKGTGAGRGGGLGQGDAMQGLGMGRGSGMAGSGMGMGQCMGPGMQGMGQGMGQGMQGMASGMGRGMGRGMGHR